MAIKTKEQAHILVMLLMLAAIVGIVGYITEPVEAKSAKLTVAAGELKIWSDWSINPCKYEYEHNGKANAKVAVNNLSSKDAKFDMGDGKVITIPAHSSISYTYRILLKGQSERFEITKLNEGTGIRVQEQLILKIQPIAK